MDRKIDYIQKIPMFLKLDKRTIFFDYIFQMYLVSKCKINHSLHMSHLEKRLNLPLAKCTMKSSICDIISFVGRFVFPQGGLSNFL
jgi:hypothetical protein